MFRWIENNPELGKVDVCIPNAGFSTSATLLEGKIIRFSSIISMLDFFIEKKIRYLLSGKELELITLINYKMCY